MLILKAGMSLPRHLLSALEATGRAVPTRTGLWSELDERTGHVDAIAEAGSFPPNSLSCILSNDWAALPIEQALRSIHFSFYKIKR